MDMGSGESSSVRGVPPKIPPRPTDQQNNLTCALDEDSKPITAFITQWGRYRYKRLPQGFIAAEYAYTRRYDEFIKYTKDKVKCVDDVLLHDLGILSFVGFLHTVC